MTTAWLLLTLYRRHTLADQVNPERTYTMGCVMNGKSGLAFFAMYEPGNIATLPDFKTPGAVVDVQTIVMTTGILTTYGYKEGREVLYNPLTNEFKEKPTGIKIRPHRMTRIQ